MAFVNELVPEDIKGEIPYLEKSRYGGCVQRGYKWTVDRDRDAYVVLLESAGGGHLGTPETEVFLLNWRGENIYFTGDKEKTADESEFCLTWRVFELDIPAALEDKKDDVYRLIRDALSARGHRYLHEVIVHERRVSVVVYVYFDSISIEN